MTNSTQPLPIVGQPFKYINGLTVSNGTNPNTLVVNSGQCRDSTNIDDIVYPVITTLNVAIVGLNGLDSGSLAASTWYGIWAIGDSSNKYPSGFVISAASNSVPVLPFGYNVYRLIDFWLTDGSSNLLPILTAGNNGILTKTFGTPITFLTNGNAAVVTDVPVNTAIPPYGYSSMKMDVSFAPAAAGNDVAIGLPGYLGSVSIFASGASRATGIYDITPTLVSGVPNINYSVVGAGSTVTLSAIGYTLVL